MPRHETMGAMAARAAETVGETTRHVRGELSDAADHAVELGRDSRDRLEGAIQTNPLIAIGIAAGVGYLVGALTHR